MAANDSSYTARPIFTAAMQLKYSLAGLTALVLAQNAFGADTVIHAGTLIDGVSATPRQNVSITIHDDKIMAVENGFTTPPGAQVIDLKNATVLPGFIDCHVHVASMLPSHENATE
jgi:adenine deaminase